MLNGSTRSTWTNLKSHSKLPMNKTCGLYPSNVEVLVSKKLLSFLVMQMKMSDVGLLYLAVAWLDSSNDS